MQARYYDPVDYLGHMQVDNSVHGFGRYTYANNNPYKYIDPDGELGMLATGFLGGALNAGIEYFTNENASGKDLAVAFGKGFVVGATGAGAANLMSKAVNIGNAASKGEKAFAAAYGGSSGAISSSLAVDLATNAAGLTDIDELDSMLNGTANALGAGSGSAISSAAKGLVNDTIAGAAGEVTAAGAAKVTDDTLKEVID